MIRSLSFWAIFAFFILSGGPSRAATPSVQTISVDQIKPGMKGYGLTVFRGTKPERFDIEVIDVLHNFRPDQDLILIRTPHPLLNQATTVAGMSGSPIFINGKLAGAYAYGWQFSKEPVAGVTPIANMLRVLRRPTPVLDRRTPPTKGKALKAETMLEGLKDKTAEKYFAQRFEQDLYQNAGSSVMSSTPLLLGGFTAQSAKLVGQYFEPLGLYPLQAGGGSKAAAKSKAPTPPFENGSAVAVQLVRGDITANAMGTVTYVEGKRLVAFGHPMFDAGETGFPIARARVLHILSNLGRSFKLAEALEPVGTLVQDRQAGIVIDTQRQPMMVPIKLRLHGVAQGVRKEWNMEVVSHPLFTPFLVFAALNNALQTAASDQSDLVFRLASKVRVANHGTVGLDDRGFLAGDDRGQMFSMSRLLPLIDVSYNNPFEQGRIEGIEVDLHVSFVRSYQEILEVSVMSTEVDPGARVPLYIRVRPYGKPEQTFIHSIDIPRHLAGQSLEVAIEPGNRVVRPFAQPNSLGDILKVVTQTYPATSMVVTTRLPAQGLQFRGQLVDHVPASVMGTLRTSHDTSFSAPFTSRTFHEIKLSSPVVGGTAIRLSVRELPRQQSKVKEVK